MWRETDNWVTSIHHGVAAGNVPFEDGDADWRLQFGGDDWVLPYVDCYPMEEMGHFTASIPRCHMLNGSVRLHTAGNEPRDVAAGGHICGSATVPIGGTANGKSFFHETFGSFPIWLHFGMVVSG